MKPFAAEKPPAEDRRPVAFIPVSAADTPGADDGRSGSHSREDLDDHTGSFPAYPIFCPPHRYILSTSVDSPSH